MVSSPNQSTSNTHAARLRAKFEHEHYNPSSVVGNRLFGTVTRNSNFRYSKLRFTGRTAAVMAFQTSKAVNRRLQYSPDHDLPQDKTIIKVKLLTYSILYHSSNWPFFQYMN